MKHHYRFCAYQARGHAECFQPHFAVRPFYRVWEPSPHMPDRQWRERDIEQDALNAERERSWAVKFKVLNS